MGWHRRHAAATWNERLTTWAKLSESSLLHHPNPHSNALEWIRTNKIWNKTLYGFSLRHKVSFHLFSVGAPHSKHIPQVPGPHKHTHTMLMFVCRICVCVRSRCWWIVLLFNRWLTIPEQIPTTTANVVRHTHEHTQLHILKQSLSPISLSTPFPTRNPHMWTKYW